jgi:hypothetical protein
LELKTKARENGALERKRCSRYKKIFGESGGALHILKEKNNWAGKLNSPTDVVQITPMDYYKEEAL